jgi:hypothetical protein
VSKFETLRDSTKPHETENHEGENLAIQRKLKGVDQQPKYSYLIKRRNGSLVKVERRQISQLRQSFTELDKPVHQKPSKPAS